MQGVSYIYVKSKQVHQKVFLDGIKILQLPFEVGIIIIKPRIYLLLASRFLYNRKYRYILCLNYVRMFMFNLTQNSVIKNNFQINKYVTY